MIGSVIEERLFEVGSRPEKPLRKKDGGQNPCKDPNGINHQDTAIREMSNLPGQLGFMSQRGGPGLPKTPLLVIQNGMSSSNKSVSGAGSQGFDGRIGNSEEGSGGSGTSGISIQA